MHHPSSRPKIDLRGFAVLLLLCAFLIAGIAMTASALGTRKSTKGKAKCGSKVKSEVYGNSGLQASVPGWARAHAMIKHPK